MMKKNITAAAYIAATTAVSIGVPAHLEAHVVVEPSKDDAVESSGGIPVHHETFVIRELSEDGTVVVLRRGSAEPANGHVDNPDGRPTGPNVPDGPVVSSR